MSAPIPAEAAALSALLARRFGLTEDDRREGRRLAYLARRSALWPESRAWIVARLRRTGLGSVAETLGPAPSGTIGRARWGLLPASPPMTSPAAPSTAIARFSGLADPTQFR